MTGFEPLIGIGTAALTGLVTDIVKTRGGKLLEQLDRDVLKPELRRSLKQYVETYSDRHGEIKIVCVQMGSPVKLDEIYTAVELLNRSDLRHYESAESLQELFRKSGKRGFAFEKAERRSGMEVANQEQYLMVLGGPGVGKSTFLRKIGLEALKGKKGEFQHPCIPVFVKLQDFKGDKPIERFIADEFESCGFPDPEEFTQAALKQGKLLLLLDGLDEVPTDQIDTAITQIENLVSRYKENRFIASCRIAAYKGGFHRFTDVTMAAFEDNQIREFIYHWFQAKPDGSNTALRCWSLLQQQDYAAAKELAQTPLLLTLLCVVYNRSLELPKNRAELYSDALNVVLKEWAAEKRLKRDPIYQEWNSKLELDLLSEIAYDSFINDELFFDKTWVIKHIEEFLISNLNAPKHLDGEDILRAIERQQGILVERARSAFSFSHLTLQEYLTAKYIIDNQETETVLEQHLTDSRWREVLLLVAGLIPGRSGVNNMLLWMEAEAQRCINTPKLKALLHWADEATQGSEGNYKPAAKRTAAIFLARALDRALDLDRARALDLALDLALALDRALDLDCARALARTRALALALDRALARAHDLAREFQKIKIFKSTDFTDLIARLKALHTEVPNNNQLAKVRRAFADRLQQLWFDALHLDLEVVTLSKAESEALNNYFYINQLMVRCQEAAVRVSPDTWAGIEERMLRVVE